jgi:formate-dependent nitrite reductase membrane component NrfD
MMPAGAQRQASLGRPWRGETYYGLPSLKASPWDWKVSAYIFVAGLAGSAQLLATIADLGGGPRAVALVRRGRYLALLGPALGAPLLIADLHTPQRWYNMVRIFRATSPMSIGTYIFSAFSLFSGIAATGQQLADRGRADGAARTLAGIAQVPAAVAGGGMSVYTAALLAATSTPFWSSATQLRAARFACSSMATAAAALSLGERDEAVANSLDGVAMASAAAEFAVTVLAERRHVEDGIELAAQRSAAGSLDRAALVLGVAVPLACYSINAIRRRRSRGLSLLAGLAVLAGGMAMRHAVLESGNDSTRRPRDYFRFAQPQRQGTDRNTMTRAAARARLRAPQPAAPLGAMRGTEDATWKVLPG